MRWPFKVTAFAAVLVPILGLTGCVYRMAAPLVVQSQQRLRIVGDAPERYDVHVQSFDYHVPTDGRLLLEFKMVHRGCSVYLFDRIPVRRVADPAKEKVVSITLGAVSLRRLSFRDLSKLQTDSEGYHQLFLFSANATPKR